jgi:hypothetical protein
MSVAAALPRQVAMLDGSVRSDSAWPKEA